MSELNADSSLEEAHLQEQASSQHTDTDRAEQKTAQHNGKMDEVQPVSTLVLVYVRFAQLGSSCTSCGCYNVWRATLIQHTQPFRLNCPQLLAVRVCLCLHAGMHVSVCIACLQIHLHTLAFTACAKSM